MKRSCQKYAKVTDTEKNARQGPSCPNETKSCKAYREIRKVEHEF